MKRKEQVSISKIKITGKASIFVSIGVIIPISICAYIAIRNIYPGAGKMENLLAVIFIMLSLCFLAIALIREVIMNLHLIGEHQRYPKGLLLPELAQRVKQQAAGLEEAAAVWHETYREVLASKGYIENIVNAITECLIAVNLDGSITWVNAGTSRLLGYETGELVSKPFAGILQEQARKVFADRNRLKRSVRNYSTSFLTKTGEIIPISLSSSPLSDNEGQVIGMIAVATDLREKKALIKELQEAKSSLERKVAERTSELAEAKDFQENIIRSMTDMLIVLDEKDIIKEVNDACEKLLGYSKKELAGEEIDKIATMFFSEKTDDTRFISKIGTEVPVSMKKTALYDKEGEQVGSLIIARDIRERLATEAKMREASRMTALGQFAAGAAHEINNPLSVISSNTEYLIEKLWDAEKKDARVTSDDIKEIIQNLDLIRRYSLSCGSSIQKLLDFARGASEFSQKNLINISAVISDTINFLEPQFKLNGISIASNISEDKFRTVGDLVKLQQVFMNALLNASEAVQKGGKITVSTFEKLTQEGAKIVVVEVTDNGCGISAENLPRVFDPFFTTKKPGTGIGLGLSVVYSIVKECKGMINIDSKQGSGTTVTITIPLADEK